MIYFIYYLWLCNKVENLKSTDCKTKSQLAAESSLTLIVSFFLAFIFQKYKFIRIDGSTPAAVRQSLCDQFQQNKECLVAVLSITAANTGDATRFTDKLF